MLSNLLFLNNMCQFNVSAGRAVAHRLQYLGQSP